MVSVSVLLTPDRLAYAQNFPSRSITLIVPQSAGGGNDVMARILAETMGPLLGQKIIVGLPGFEAEQRYGLIAPARMPPAVVEKLNAALRRSLTSPNVIARIAADGAEPTPTSPHTYAEDIDREEQKWSKVVREAAKP